MAVKKNEIFKKANSNLQKFQEFSRIDWCGSTYMFMRLSDVSSKTAWKHKKMHFLPVFELMLDSLTTT